MPRYTTDQIIFALEKVNGMVYLAAKTLGCSVNTIYKRRDKSKRVREAIGQSRGEVVDLAEQKLLAAVIAGEPWAIALVLKTLGKERGYVERQQIDHNGNVSTPTTFAEWLKIETARLKKEHP